MKKEVFIREFMPLARQAGEAFRINPVMILAQAVLESGWGGSVLAKEYRNYFGLSGYGNANSYWEGHTVKLRKDSLSFRVYRLAQDSFNDYAQLIRQAYPQAADLSHSPEAFARAIAYSKYISEVNGDNREAYNKALCRLCRQIQLVVDN